jgi:hypothetical protein
MCESRSSPSTPPGDNPPRGTPRKDSPPRSTPPEDTPPSGTAPSGSVATAHRGATDVPTSTRPHGLSPPAP